MKQRGGCKVYFLFEFLVYTCRTCDASGDDCRVFTVKTVKKKKEKKESLYKM